MGDNQSANLAQGGVVTDPAQTVAEGKGKGKAEAQDVSMGEEDSSSDEETGAEDDAPDAPEEEDEDNMEEIDTGNIVSSRTRGKNIDWNKAAEENKDVLGDEDDDEDDEDFEEKDEDMRD
ncbi:MAG: hypothetical protein Q9163_006168 [Psora crenata]